MMPLFVEVRRKAMKSREWITEEVLMADDSIKTIRFGPRGGWKVIPCNKT